MLGRSAPKRASPPVQPSQPHDVGKISANLSSDTVSGGKEATSTGYSHIRGYTQLEPPNDRHCSVRDTRPTRKARRDLVQRLKVDMKGYEREARIFK